MSLQKAVMYLMMLSIQNIRSRRMNWERIYRIIETEGMIKSERKVRAVIYNAQCFLEVREESGTFSDFCGALRMAR